MYTEEELKKIKISIVMKNSVAIDGNGNEQTIDYSFSNEEKLPIHFKLDEGTKPLFDGEYVNRVRTPSPKDFSRSSNITRGNENSYLETVLYKLEDMIKEIKKKIKKTETNKNKRPRSRNTLYSERLKPNTKSPRRKRMRRDSEYSNRRNYGHSSSLRDNNEDNLSSSQSRSRSKSSRREFGRRNSRSRSPNYSTANTENKASYSRRNRSRSNESRRSRRTRSRSKSLRGEFGSRNSRSRSRPRSSSTNERHHRRSRSPPRHDRHHPTHVAPFPLDPVAIGAYPFTMDPDFRFYGPAHPIWRQGPIRDPSTEMLPRGLIPPRGMYRAPMFGMRPPSPPRLSTDYKKKYS